MVARCVILFSKTLGGKLPPVSGPLAVIWGAVSFSCELYAKRGPSMKDLLLSGPACGELRGENWKPGGNPLTP